MSEDILANRMLKSANISEQNQQLACATITELKYNMKSQLIFFYGDSSDSLSSEPNVKIENINENTMYENDILYGYDNSSCGRGWSYRNQGHYQRGNGSRGGREMTASFGGRGMTANSVSARGVFKPKRIKNPVNERGMSSRCAVYDSINHLAVNWPDATYLLR